MKQDLPEALARQDGNDTGGGLSRGALRAPAGLAGNPGTPDDSRESLHALLAAQREAHLRAPFPAWSERARHLRALRDVLFAHQDALAEAMNADFGQRSKAEVALAEFVVLKQEIDAALKHGERWMRAQRRRAGKWLAPGRARVVPQPLGVVGIVVPWNYPLLLGASPLVCALAAGNRAMIKMSELTPRTSALFEALIGQTFAREHVAVVNGDAAVGAAFTALPFDHLLFTGSTRVGKIVMKAAAENLVPVTLELGGKSPAIVSRSADLSRAARRIAHGKTVNAGQICVAPDYALVPREQAHAFVAAVQRAAVQLVGEGAHYTSMIDARARDRMLALIEDARALGATITVCGSFGREGPGARQVPLHIVTGVRPTMRIAREEIFGPILPVIEYDTFDDALAWVRNGERPLALYWFGTDGGERERVLRDTHAGGVTLNDWGWHAMNHALPFGGTGTSGMGNYHGEEGFRELSHAKAVFSEHRWFPIELFHPPYGRAVQRAVLRWYFGARS